jgi:hypothetical protein
MGNRLSEASWWLSEEPLMMYTVQAIAEQILKNKGIDGDNLRGLMKGILDKVKRDEENQLKRNDENVGKD